MENGFYWIRHLNDPRIKDQIVKVEENEVWFFGKDYPIEFKKLPEYEFLSGKLDSYYPDDILKKNILRLVEDHRQKCDVDCNITLMFVKELAQKAGIKFSEKESLLFL